MQYSTTHLLPPKTNWSKSEDMQLTTAVQQFGAKRWNFIAQYVPGRTGKQCRERWLSHISPDVKNGNWTCDEINLLVRLQKEFGNKWSNISRFFANRPPNVIKNKFNCLLRRSKSMNAKSNPLVMIEEPSSPEVIVQTKHVKPKRVISDVMHFDFIDDIIFECGEQNKENWEEEF